MTIKSEKKHKRKKIVSSILRLLVDYQRQVHLLLSSTTIYIAAYIGLRLSWMRFRTAQHPRMRWENCSRLSNSTTARSHFRRRFRESSPPRSQFLLFVSDQRWHLTCVASRFTACFLFMSSPSLSISHIASTLYISLSLSVLPSYPSYLRGQSYGESDGGVGRGSRVDEGRRRETEGGRAVRWINSRLADGLSFVTLSPSYRPSFSPPSSSSSAAASSSGSSRRLSFSLFASVSRCSIMLSLTPSSFDEK